MDENNISTKIVEDLFDGVESDIQNEIRLNSKKIYACIKYQKDILFKITKGWIC